MLSTQFALAQTYTRQGRLNEAHQLLLQLVNSYPQNGWVHFNIGKFYLEIKATDSAIKHLTKSCELLPSESVCLLSLLDAFEEINAHQDVNTLISFLKERFHEEPQISYRISQYKMEIGEFEEAYTEAEHCLSISDNTLLEAYVHTQFIHLSKALNRLPPNFHKRVENLLTRIDKDQQLTDSEKIQAKIITKFTLGECLHLQNKCNEAFEMWHEANAMQLRLSRFSTLSLNAFFKSIKNADKAETPTSDPESEMSDFAPIFIVGLPRCGSTLLEQMFLQHVNIPSIGESDLLSRQVAGFIENTFKSPFPDFMKALSARHSAGDFSIANKAASIYRQFLAQKQIHGNLIVDKMLANFQSIGLIKAIFPKAKIIQLTRDYHDMAFSIYRNHFAENEPYFCDLEELQLYHAHYTDMMKHWQRMFKDEILTVHYEELVSDPTFVFRKILKYCGLNNLHQQVDLAKSTQQTQIPVKTLSATQVRANIHQKAIGSGSPYIGLMQSVLNKNK